MPPAINRLRDSLAGLSVGDAFGQQHFLRDARHDHTVRDGPWPWTDDTEMACGIARMLFERGGIDQPLLAERFVTFADRGRGYGAGMIFDLFPRLQRGERWDQAAAALFDGSGSWGNGAAMRVAPLGAFFADDPDRAAEQAAKSAVVTHAHDRARDGAVAIAVAAATLCDSGFDGNLFEAALRHLPERSHMRVRIETADELRDETDPFEVARQVGNGAAIAAHDTVPFCLWVADRHRDDFRTAIETTVGVGGDLDTNAAIVGGMLGARVGREGIPDGWLANREPLPGWLPPELRE